jgi:hypothetical protein
VRPKATGIAGRLALACDRRERENRDAGVMKSQPLEVGEAQPTGAERFPNEKIKRFTRSTPASIAAER